MTIVLDDAGRGVTTKLPASRVPTTLVFANLLRNRTRLVVALVGVAFSIFLMVFQASLLIGFIRATGGVIRSVDGAVWIVPRGLPCFDFAARVPRRFADLARQAAGVDDVVAVEAGFATLVRPDGARRAVLLVGAEPSAGPRFPFPADPGGTIVPDGITIDHSNAALLGIRAQPVRLEVAGRRAIAVREVDGFGSFLGSPYVFAGYGDARRMLRAGPEDTSFLVVRLTDGADAGAVVETLRRRLPESDVLTRGEFAARSASFWLVQTGAGGAILVAALLGFAVGLVITSQTMYANTMEQIDEFATLKAIGAENDTVARLVLCQATLVGAAGASIGTLVTWPLVTLAREYLVAWIATPWWLRAAAPLAGVLMCCLGSLASVRRVIAVDPVTILRR
jgi:putative ABC transport system permease protein